MMMMMMVLLLLLLLLLMIYMYKELPMEDDSTALEASSPLPFRFVPALGTVKEKKLILRNLF